MGIFSGRKAYVVAFIAGLTVGFNTPAVALTVSEADLGGFSGDFRAPTVVGNGPDTITGQWSGGNDYDILALTGLSAGAQTVTLRFAPLTPIGPTDWSFAAGGTVLWKTSPFQYSAWEGQGMFNLGIAYWNRAQDQSYSIALGSDFGGKLWLGLLNTYGTLGYAIAAPGNAAPPPPVLNLPDDPVPVPLPAGGALLGGALAALAAWRRRAA